MTETYYIRNLEAALEQRISKPADGFDSYFYLTDALGFSSGERYNPLGFSSGERYNPTASTAAAYGLYAPWI